MYLVAATKNMDEQKIVKLETKPPQKHPETLQLKTGSFRVQESRGNDGPGAP